MNLPEFTDPDLSRRWHAAHRAALDHVLALTTGQWWSGSLILRGSMVLPVWLGAAARPPADLDWVVLGPSDDPGSLSFGADHELFVGGLGDLAEIVDRVDLGDLAEAAEVFPHIERGEVVHRIDELERLDVAPTAPPYGDLLDLLAERPLAAGGVFLDTAEVAAAMDWEFSGYVGTGVRLTIPWRAPGLPPGQVQLDFAIAETVPESPSPMAVPAAGGGPPAVVLAASRELSLAWKLLWMRLDVGTAEYGYGTVRGKDLYDAVLLAEDCRWDEAARLLHAVAADRADVTLDDVTAWPVDWDDFRADHPWVTGTAKEWLGRLAALPPLPPDTTTDPAMDRALADLAAHWNSR